MLGICAWTYHNYTVHYIISKMTNPEKRRIILGLGNPGAEYENTYHNVGVLAVEYLAKAIANGEDFEWKAERKLFLHGDWRSEIGDLKIVFIKPLVFMNESGLAAKE